MANSILAVEIRAQVTILSPSTDIFAKIIEDNTFENPKFIDNEKNGYSNYGVSEKIKVFEIVDNVIIVPIGYLHDLYYFCQENDISIDFKDHRTLQPSTFQELKGITLRPYQKRAVNQALLVYQGVVVSPTGSGKSLLGLELIRRRQQKSLIIVHRKELADQWAQVIKRCLGIKVGRIGSGTWEVGEQITVGLIQTLAKREEELEKLGSEIGLILCDECHHVPSQTFFDVLSRLPAKFRYGLSATPTRRDGLENLIYRAIGPIVSIIEKEEVESIGGTVPARVALIDTGLDPGLIGSWNEFLDAICTNSARNELIINLAKHCTSSVLILVDRVAHACDLSGMLSRRNIEHVLAHGQLSKHDREGAMGKIKSAPIVVGTTGLLGEGLDVSHWSVLIMATPISSEIKLMQAVGRIVRPSKDKEIGLVYDLRDNHAFAGASFKNRFAIYQKHGIWVQFPKDHNKHGGSK